ncbi:UbiA family prenyltransferase [Nocardioides sp.]|uniref:UbiA family prenyltransferase n=1 Tax=Nocardioides sp. TaxID=35761 RepID=UPI0039E410B0
MTTPADVPLVVDLDGTLIRTDLLLETASRFVTQQPWRLTRLPGWLVQGRSRLKAELTSQAEVDVSSLPYDDHTLGWLREEHAAGRRLVLASASDERLVRRVADHLGIFDEIHGSTSEVNLKGPRKRDLLVSRFGERGFDYVGDSRADEVVFDSALTAHRVARPRGRARAFARALRPHQWVKNALVALPLFTAQRLDDGGAVAATVLAVMTFSLTASATYLLNDIADVDSDRRHPIKRDRPFASGRLSLATGWVAAPAMLVLAFALAAIWLPPVFVAVLAAYLVITVAYTVRLKRKAVLDVVTLGVLYTIRIVAGAAAITVSLSLWLLTFSMLFFLSLALVKRVSELTRLRRTQAGAMRGRGYLDADLELLSSYGVATSVGAVVIFSLYVNDPVTSELYETPELLWLTVPVLLAWLMRVWLRAHRGEMDEDPIVFAIRDRASLLAGGLIVLAFVAAKVVSS